MDEREQELRRAGLCGICVCGRLVRSDRGAVFYQCARHEIDASYPKYPRLPVMACRGFEPATPANGDTHLPTRQF
jgi:hypothetical protein